MLTRESKEKKGTQRRLKCELEIKTLLARVHFFTSIVSLAIFSLETDCYAHRFLYLEMNAYQQQKLTNEIENRKKILTNLVVFQGKH